MAPDEVSRLGNSSELDDMHSSESNSTDRNNANGPGSVVNDMDNSIFIMDGFDQSNKENQDARTALVEISSVSVIAVGDTQTHNCGGNDSLSVQNEESSGGKVDGDKEHVDELKNKESSVRVVFNSLPSRSKRKLEELLHQWSEWHAQNFISTEDPTIGVESGEEIYFPALKVGSGKSPAVSFSMDVPDRKRQRKDTLIMSDCSALYDRGYAVGLSFDEGNTEESFVDLREAPRCFNCGSFNHPLRDCQKPFNRAAVSSARKQFSSKKNQQSGPRVPTRYYLDSPGGKFSSGGKFDGLKPGALSDETKKMLGLGELDPPPWLNRMRELGYPPGYLDSEEEEQPSGIEIFGDEEIQKIDGRKDLPSEVTKSEKKMTIDFPGINAPIPENADQKSWTAPVASRPDYSFHRQDNVRRIHAESSMNNGPFQGANWLSDHLEAQSSQFGIGLSSPSHHDHINNYHPRDPFGPPREPFGPPGQPFAPPREPFGSPREPFGPPREPFSPRGAVFPGSPHYGRADDARRPPMFHHNIYGSSL